MSHLPGWRLSLKADLLELIEEFKFVCLGEAFSPLGLSLRLIPATTVAVATTVARLAPLAILVYAESKKEVQNF